MGVTAEGLVYFFTALNIIAGLWLVYHIIEPRLRRWRADRGSTCNNLSSPPPVQPPPPSAKTRLIVAVRGYDSPELCRVDTLIRIRQLGNKIARYLREMERYKDLK